MAGMIMSTDQYAKQLAALNRDYYGRKTWESLYSSVDLSKQQQIGQLTEDYSSAIADAYNIAYKNNATIAASNLGQGYKALAMEETDAALEEAYNTYRQNYLSSVADVESSAASASASITDALMTEAQYTKDMSEAGYQYLQYLWEKQQAGELLDQNGVAFNLFDEADWLKYTYEDSEGNRQLKSWDQLVTGFTDAAGVEHAGMYTEDYELTAAGVDFYDQMFNDLANEHRGVAFGDWLNETNPELYNWSQSDNPYDYAPGLAGDNKHLNSFKTLYGMRSDDETYSFIERYGGITQSQMNDMFSSFTDAVNALNAEVSDSSGMNAKDITKSYQDITAEVKTVTDQLGITDAIENEMGMSFDALAEQMAELTSAASSEGEIVWDSIASGLTFGLVSGGAAVGAAAAGTAAGAASAASSAGVSGTLLGAAGASSSVPVAGWIIAAVLATGAAVWSGIDTGNSMKKQNKELMKAAQQYNSLVVNLIAYAEAQRVSTQSKYTK